MWYTDFVTLDDRKQASVACRTCTTISLFFLVLPWEFPDRPLNVYRLKALLWQGFVEESKFGKPEK